MDKLVIYLALNGALVLTLSCIAGLYLYLAILHEKTPDAWHLLHAGGTGRGVMLLALAAVLQYIELSLGLLSLAVWLILFFTWTSMLAMGIRAVTGDRGLRLSGTVGNRAVYLLYAAGTVAIFPALGLIILGLVKAL